MAVFGLSSSPWTGFDEPFCGLALGDVLITVVLQLGMDIIYIYYIIYIYIYIYNTNTDLANIKCSRLLYSIYSPSPELEVPTSPGARPVPS